MVIGITNKLHDFCKKIQLNFKNNKAMWIGLTITCVLFVILYHKFLFEGYAYAYSFDDIGSDTVTTYIPRYYFISDIIHNIGIKTYYLQVGFGSNMMSVLQSVVNPFDLLVVMFKPEHIYIGILLSTFLKYITIIVFSIKFFGLLFKRDSVKLICALLWTFSSYIVVWGQHYGFATVMAGFTIFIYYFHQFLTKDKIDFKFILSMIFYIICSYYFFYSSGIFVAIYTIVFLRSKKENFKLILIKLFKLLAIAILSIGLSAIILLPVLIVFFQSDRTASITDTAGFFSPLLLSLKYIASLITRFVSPDLIGGGNYTSYYSGPMNYYEFAFLSTSVLAIFALVKYVMISNEKIKRLFILLLIILALLWPGTNYLFCFDNKMRWTYILLIPIIILIGRLINDSIYRYNKKEAITIVVVSCFVYAIACSIILLASRRGQINLNMKIFLLETAIFVIFAIILLRKNISNSVLTTALILLTLSEFTMNNYHSINERGIKKIAEINENYYFDGTEKVVKAISNEDNELYRVNKNFDSLFYNDAYVQGYNGVASYDSFNTKELCEMMKDYEVKSVFDLPHYQRLGVERTFLNALFGVKYTIYDSNLGKENLIAKENGKYGYLNPYWIPFGFLYDNDYENELPIDESLLMEDYSKYVKDSISLFDYDYETINGSMINSTLIAKNEDSQLVFEIPDDVDLEKVGLYIDVDIDQETPGQIFYANSKNFQSDKYLDIQLKKGNNKITMNLKGLSLSPKSRTIRIDLSTFKQNIKINHIEFQTYDFSEILTKISQYRKNSLKDMKYDFNSINGTIYNNSDADKEFFIPIVFSNEWSAYVDGKQVEIVNRENFITFNIPKGKHNVKLVCKPTGILTGISVSLGSLAVLFFLNKKFSFLQFKRNMR